MTKITCYHCDHGKVASDGMCLCCPKCVTRVEHRCDLCEACYECDQTWCDYCGECSCQCGDDCERCKTCGWKQSTECRCIALDHPDGQAAAEYVMTAKMNMQQWDTVLRPDRATWFPVLYHHLRPVAELVLAKVFEGLTPQQALKMRLVCKEWANVAVWKLYPWWDHRGVITRTWQHGHRYSDGAWKFWKMLSDRLCIVNRRFQSEDYDTLSWRIQLEVARLSRIHHRRKCVAYCSDHTPANTRGGTTNATCSKCQWKDKVTRLEQEGYSDKLLDLHVKMYPWMAEPLLMHGLTLMAFPKCTACIARGSACYHRMERVAGFIRKAMDNQADRMARALYDVVFRSGNSGSPDYLNNCRHLLQYLVVGGVDVKQLMTDRMIFDLYHVAQADSLECWQSREMLCWLFTHIYDGDLTRFVALSNEMSPFHKRVEWMIHYPELWEDLLKNQPGAVRAVLDTTVWWITHPSGTSVFCAKMANCLSFMLKCIPLARWRELVSPSVIETAMKHGVRVQLPDFEGVKLPQLPEPYEQIASRYTGRRRRSAVEEEAVSPEKRQKVHRQQPVSIVLTKTPDEPQLKRVKISNNNEQCLY